MPFDIEDWELASDYTMTTTSLQEEAPSEAHDGDLWFDVADSNHPYRYENDEWVDVRDEGAVAPVIQHFWNDAEGVHVSTEESNPVADRNMLLNSIGMMFRKLGNYLVTITDNAVSFWDGLGNGGSHVLASFGKDGARIGRANEINDTIGNEGFTVKAGNDELFAVDADTVMPEEALGTWPKRKVYKVYRAGYLEEGGSIGPIIEEGYLHISSPLDEPDVQLFFGDTWQSDGSISGATGMLMSVGELLEHYDYSAYGSDLPIELEPYYDLEVDTEAVSNYPRITNIKYEDNTFIPFRCGFSQEVLDQIPQDAWDASAIAAGTCNWFIGSVYDVAEATLRLNGVPWSGSTPDDFQGCTDEEPGVHGLVPASDIGEQNGLLGGDAEWHPPLEDLDIEALLTNAG